LLARFATVECRYSMVQHPDFKHFRKLAVECGIEPMGDMADDRVYLDHNATTPMRPAAVEAMTAALNLTGNPSSVHAEGRAARAAIDKARVQIARAVGGEAKNVIFTSGATEALNTLLRPSPAVTWRDGARRSERLLVLATEHSAALAGGAFAPDRIDELPVDTDGFLNILSATGYPARLAQLAEQNNGLAPAMVAIQLANSETGVIQPVDGWAELAHRYGALLVSDAVAAFGKIPLDIKKLNVDAIVISAHKFGGPKGAGAIIMNGDRLQVAEPLLKGGGQEMRRRSGTENVAAVVGMGAAAEEAAGQIAIESARIIALRDRLLEGFRAHRPDIVVFGENAPRLPNTLNIGLPGQKAETTVIAFDLAGIAVSSGSACSSGKVKRSHVLDAMGIAPELAETALRFSLGWTTTETDIDRAINAFAKVAGRHQRAAA
jgi:cysteine desulfurase